jgi:hypothetical protein
MLLALHPPLDVGEDRLGQHDQVEVVQHDPGAQQRPADPGRVRRRRVHDSDLRSAGEALAVQLQPALRAPARAPGSQPDEAAARGQVQVYDRLSAARENAYQAQNLREGRKIAEQVLASFATCPIPEIKRLGKTLKQ